MSPDDLKALVRSIPDFPKPGIVFRDVTTLIAHGEGFAATVDWFVSSAHARRAEVIVGIEARGFIFGAAAAVALRLPFVPVRKPGRLPVPVLAIDYALEYGTDTLEIDPGAIKDGQRVVLIDDLLATGGTAEAAIRLIRKSGGIVEQALFAIDLPDLEGSQRIAKVGVQCEALIAFAGH